MEHIIKNTRLMLERRQYGNLTMTKNITPVISHKLIGDKWVDENDKRKLDRVSVFFIPAVKVSIDTIRTILELCDTVNIIIIHEKLLTPDVRHAVEINKIVSFEVFFFFEMAYDPIEIVPKHYVSTEHISEKNRLPVILASDIVSRYYKFTKGMIICIEEPNENDDTVIPTFRRCV